MTLSENQRKFLEENMQRMGVSDDGILWSKVEDAVEAVILHAQYPLYVAAAELVYEKLKAESVSEEERMAALDQFVSLHETMSAVADSHYITNTALLIGLRGIK